MGKLKLCLYAGRIAHISFTYEKFTKIDCFQTTDCNVPLVIKSSYKS